MRRDNVAKSDDAEEKEKLNPYNVLVPKSSSHEVKVTRKVYQQESLNKDADYHFPKKTWRKKIRKLLLDCGYEDCIRSALPIIQWLPKYKVKEYLLNDIVAGVTTSIMHIPQGMAYALLAEIPPISGLYMAFLPVLTYVIFGTSPHISIGTFAVACLMAGKVVNTHAAHPENLTALSQTLVPFSASNSTGLDTITVGLSNMANVTLPTPLEVMGALCFGVGSLQALMWVLRMGCVAALLSESLVSGFTTAATVTVIASQLKDLFGIRLPKLNGNFKVILTVVEIVKRITTVNWAALIISFCTCTLLLCSNNFLKPWMSKRSRFPIPTELVAIVVGTLVSRFADLNSAYQITLVGHIPTGLPSPTVPKLELVPPLLVDAFVIMMVTYSVSMSMALIFAAKDKYEISANQELLAMGAANIVGSFVSCAPICASLSRSYIQYKAGAKTGVTSVVTASVILCVLLWIGPFFEQLPRCVLASIIVVSLQGMAMQIFEVCRFWKLSRMDALVWMVTFLVTLIVNIDYGLVAGLLASLGALFMVSQKPYTCLLGRVLNTDLYLDIKRYRAAEEIPGIKIFHYCGGLNFATKHLFTQTLYRKVGYMKAKVAVSPDEDNNLMRSESGYVWDPTLGQRVKCIIIDATALSYVDAPGVKALVAIQQELHSSHIKLLLAGANGPVLEMIERFNRLETDQLKLDTYPTVHDAVVYYKIIEQKNEKLQKSVLISDEQ